MSYASNSHQKRLGSNASRSRISQQRSISNAGRASIQTFANNGGMGNLPSSRQQNAGFSPDIRRKNNKDQDLLSMNAGDEPDFL